MILVRKRYKEATQQTDLELARTNDLEIPLIARIGNNAPDVVGRTAPKAAAYAPLAFMAGGIGAVPAVLTNAGVSGADAFFTARGLGDDYQTSAQAGALGALQGGLVPLAGRYGVAPGVTANLAATYASGRVQGLSDEEIEQQMLAVLVQEGAFQVGRLQAGKNPARLMDDVKAIVDGAAQMHEAVATRIGQANDRLIGGLSQFTLQSKISLSALKAAYAELVKLKPQPLAA
jgi:hypothetical protein